jgi:hypothetical protein
MDIIIMLLLLATAVLMLTDVSRRAILATWIAAALLTAGLFNHHVTSALSLSF